MEMSAPSVFGVLRNDLSEFHEDAGHVTGMGASERVGNGVAKCQENA